MIKIYQKIIDPIKGDCMQAVIASLFNKKLDDVPKFIETTERSWFGGIHEFVKIQGYKLNGTLYNKNYSRLLSPTSSCFKEENWHKSSIITKKALYKYSGVNGLFYAGVFSPKFFTWKKQKSHAVIIDRDFNIVHDPSPAYQDILEYPLKNVLGYNGIIDVMLINSNN